MLLAATVSSCNNGEGGGKPAAGLEHIVNEWKLATWGGADAPFTVYIDFNEDNTYEMYQQVYGLEFVKFSGTYNVSGSIVTGTYSDGQNWKSGYKDYMHFSFFDERFRGGRREEHLSPRIFALRLRHARLSA